MANTLADYLISIGFDVKSSEQQKLKEAVREGAFQADVLFSAIKAAVSAFAKAIEDVTDGLNELFISSRVWATSAAGMATFGEAAKRVGISTQQATNFYKIFTDQGAKANPVLAGLARNFSHVSDAAWKSLSPAQRSLAFLKGMSGQNEFVQANFADKFGLSYEQLKQLEDPEFAESINRVQGIYKSLGLNLDGSAEGAHKLFIALSDLGTTLEGIATKAAADLFEKYGKDIKALQQFLQQHGKEIADDFSGIAGAVLDIGKAFVTIGDDLHIWERLLDLMTLVKDEMKLIATIATDIATGNFSRIPGDLAAGTQAMAGDAARELGIDGGAQPGDTRNWWQRNAPKWAGGKDAPIGNVHPLAAHGSLATHQQEAYAAARAEGLSDNAAKALVANFSGESLRNPSDTSGDGGAAQGIGQWHADRAQAIKDHFGKYPAEMSVAEQTRAAIWEMKNNKAYRASWDALNGNGSAADMVGTLVNNYERPADRYGATRNRVAFLNGFRPNTAPDRTVPATGWAAALGISPAHAATLGQSGSGGPVGAHYNPFGDLSGASQSFGVNPAPAPSAIHNQHTSSLDQKTDIHIYGVGDGHEELGAKVARYQSGVNADLLRSLQGASVG